MAKTRSIARTQYFAPPSARPQIVVMGGQKSVSRRRRASVARPKKHHRRSGGGHKLPVTSVAVGGLIVGYAQAKGLLDKLPQIGGSKTFTLGLVGYAATKFFRNPTVRMAGLSAIAVAAADFGRVQGGGTSGDDMGDDVGDDEV